MRVPVIAIGLAASIALGSGAALAENVLKQNAREDRVGALISSSQDIGPVCMPVSFNIYFEKDRAELSKPAETTLDLIGGQMQGCTIRAVSIGAEGQAVASAEGRKLAGQRGAAVLGALNERGIEPEAIVIAQNNVKEPASASPDHLEISIAPKPVEQPMPKPQVVARNEV